MRMIILRARAARESPQESIFIVVVILITKVPIETSVQPNGQPPFRGLKAHRIRIDERAGIAGRIRQTVSLPIVLIDAIRTVERKPRSRAPHHIREKEIVSLKVERV